MQDTTQPIDTRQVRSETEQIRAELEAIASWLGRIGERIAQLAHTDTRADES